ncbi:MAG: transporter, partial [bacterium]
MNKSILWFILLLFIFSNIEAQILTDRPDQTESAATVPGGSLQVESGLFLGYEEYTNPSARILLLPTNLFRYGLADIIEIRLVSQFLSLKVEDETYQGIDDLQIGTKIRLLGGSDRNTQIAFLTHLLVPTGTNGVSIENFGTINKLSISHTLTENMGLGYNVGYDYFGFGKGIIVYSLSLGIGINERLAIFLEPYGNVPDLEEFILNFDTGFTFLANDNLQFDFLFGTGITHRMNFMSIGC